MSGQERRIFHRFNHALGFATKIQGVEVVGKTLNTSSGGSLIAVPETPIYGDRLHLNMTPDQENAVVVAVVEAVHCGKPGDDGLFRIGVRWVELYSVVGEEGIEEFLVKVLGMTNSRIRHVRTPEEKYVFEFPSFFFQSGGRVSDLADLLEPQLPTERALRGDESGADGERSRTSTEGGGSEGEKARNLVDRNPDDKSVHWDEIEPVLRGLSARSRSTRARNELKDPETLARMTQASTRKVPPLKLVVKVRGKKHRGMLCRIGLMSMDLIAEEGIPRAYDRGSAHLKLPNGPSSTAEVILSGTVSRVKEDGTYTIRFTRVEEKGNEGLFEAFVLTLLERDTPA